jgi:protein-export membrane protein SecD
MAVDANVLIFERTKEELRKGLDSISATREGFKHAWTAIRDSNVSTIITTLILFNVTSGFVKGLALTLLLGVLVSMFTAITVTRGLMVLAQRKTV